MNNQGRSTLYLKKNTISDEERQNDELTNDSVSRKILTDFIKEGETIGTAAVVIQVHVEFCYSKYFFWQKNEEKPRRT